MGFELLLSNKILFTAFFILISTAKSLTRFVITDYYLILRNNSNMPQAEKNKFGISFYKLLYGIVAVSTGLYLVHNEKWILKYYTYGEGSISVPYKFQAYYIMAISFYLVELITIFYEPKKKDYLQMILHHIATLILLNLSFNNELYKYGVAILFLHDISDPFLELAKIENYLKNQVGADVAFLIFMTVFMISRLLIYPRYILWTLIREDLSKDVSKSDIIILIALCALQLMHVIWSKYIIALLLKVIHGDKVKDVREQK